jgi:hypothetical protein
MGLTVPGKVYTRTTQYVHVPFRKTCTDIIATKQKIQKIKNGK